MKIVFPSFLWDSASGRTCSPFRVPTFSITSDAGSDDAFTAALSLWGAGGAADDACIFLSFANYSRRKQVLDPGQGRVRDNHALTSGLDLKESMLIKKQRAM